MAERKIRILIAALLWILILGGIAATVRYFIRPQLDQRRHHKLASQTGSEGRYKHKVLLAADGFSGYALLRSPNLEERLKRKGILLSVVDDGADYRARLRALEDGDVELAVFPINSYLQTGAERGVFPGSIIYLVDETRGADAIIAYKDAVPNIDALNTAKARIVATPDSPSEFLARVLLASFNLPQLANQRWMIPADGSTDVYKQFRGDSRKKPMAYALWEPEVSKALRDDNAHVLLDSAKVSGYIFDVLVARREFLVDHYDVAKQIIEAYASTVYAHRQNMADQVMADAKAQGDRIDVRDARSMVKGILWKNTLENYTHFGLSSESAQLENIEDILLKIGDVLSQTGVLKPGALDRVTSSLYYDKILRDMQEAQFHPGTSLQVVQGIKPSGSDEKIRGAGKLKALSEGEWATLATVGELRVNPVTFGRGTARLTIQGTHELQSLAKTMQSWPSYYLTVTGRVRPGGDAQASMALAKSRAQAAVEILTRQGVASTRIRVLAEIGTEDRTAAQSVSFIVGQQPY